MANENETVEQVCEELRAGNMVWLANRILAVHKREILVERNLANEHIICLQDKIAAISAERDEWQKQALEENAALDVARADLAAKDAEIARLKQEAENGIGDFAKAVCGMIKRDALIKEFVELLNKLIPDKCYGVCGKDPCDHIAVLEDIKAKGGEPCPCVLLSALIAKAQEVVSKTETTTEVSND